MRDPFVGLRPFAAADRDIFFGRGREVTILKNLVLSQPIVVVYSTSGVGKSSLLTAGLMPQLADEGETSVVYIRDPGDDVVARSSDGLGLEVGSDRTLEGTLEAYRRQSDLRPVVIIDQFEERLKRAGSLENLWNSLAYIANSRSDLGCVVISIREDYLAQLSDLFEIVPGLLDGSFRVPNLSETAFREAVHGPIRAVGGGIEVPQPLIDEVLTDLRNQAVDGDADPERIEAGYFQIVWSFLWNISRSRKSDEITPDDYRAAGGTRGIVSEFVDSTVAALLPLEAEALHAILRYLVVPTGAKIPLTIDDLAGLIRASDFTPLGQRAIHPVPERLRMLLDSLLIKLTSSSAPLLRRVARGQRVEYELVHDLLGRILLSWRDAWAGREAETTNALTSEFSSELGRRLQEIARREPESASVEEWSAWLHQVAAEAESALATIFRGPLQGRVTGAPLLNIPQPVVEDALLSVAAAVSYAGEPVDYGKFTDFERTYELQRALGPTADKLKSQLQANLDEALDTFSSRHFKASLEPGSDAQRRQSQETVVRLSVLKGESRGRIPRGPSFSNRHVPTLVKVTRVLVSGVVGYLVAVAGFGLSWAALRQIFEVPTIHYLALAALVVTSAFAMAYGAGFGMTRWPSIHQPVGAPGGSTLGALRRTVYVRFRADGHGPWRKAAAALTVLFGVWPLPIVLHTLVALGGAKAFDALGWAPTAGFDFVGLIALVPAVIMTGLVLQDGE